MHVKRLDGRMENAGKKCVVTDVRIRIVFDNFLCIFRIVELGNVSLHERISSFLERKKTIEKRKKKIPLATIPPACPSFACCVDNVRT